MAMIPLEILQIRYQFIYINKLFCYLLFILLIFLISDSFSFAKDNHQINKLDEFVTAIKSLKSPDERIKICKDTLKTGKLNEDESAYVYGIMAAGYYDKAMRQINQSRDSKKSANTNSIALLLRESIRHYDTAISTAFGAYYVHYWNRGYNYELLGYNEKALENYTDTIIFKPDFRKGYLYRARVHEKLGNKEQARLDHEKAKSLEK